MRGIYVRELNDVTLPLQRVQKVPLNSSNLVRKGKKLGYDKVFQQLAQLYTKLGDADKEIFWRTLVMDRNRTSMDEVYPAPQEFGTTLGVLFGQESLPESFRPQLPQPYI